LNAAMQMSSYVSSKWDIELLKLLRSMARKKISTRKR
jgi:hypothetical protein